MARAVVVMAAVATTDVQVQAATVVGVVMHGVECRESETESEMALSGVGLVPEVRDC